MKQDEEKMEKKVPTSLAALDLDILTKIEGAEVAKQIMLTASAISKEGEVEKISH